MPRNKVILNTLYKSKDVEIFGSGFRKVYALCDADKVKVESSSGNGGFSFSFYRDKVENHVTGNVTVKQSGTGKVFEYPTDHKVYMLLKEDPIQTRENLANQTGKTVRTIQRALDKLTDENKIRRVGSNKTGYWEVL